MKPGARLQASIELLGQVAGTRQPADRTVTAYLRNRRYIGAKDRRAINDRIFGILRATARLDWCWARASGHDTVAAEETAQTGGDTRARVLAAGVLLEDLTPEQIAAFCDGTAYAPAPLSAAERETLTQLAHMTLSNPAQPQWVQWETPTWLLPSFERVFGEDTEANLRALSEAAPLDLRVNTLRDDSRDDVHAALAEEGITVHPTPYAPNGLRVAGRRAVTDTHTFKAGDIEVQDEGAQIVAALTDARPGMAVCDLCAGAGGKTLALAADMQDRGRLVALDRDDGRLNAAEPRLRRAGVHNVERRRLTGPADPWLSDNAARFDRVLVDAPCTGTGRWRRQPDTRWRLTSEALAARTAAQDETLVQAAALVRPGGRLIYATCSILPEEGADRIAALQANRPDLAAVPITAAWSAKSPAPPLADPMRDDLILTPAWHGTDGFFVAILTRTEMAS